MADFGHLQQTSVHGDFLGKGHPISLGTILDVPLSSGHLGSYPGVYCTSTSLARESEGEYFSILKLLEATLTHRTDTVLKIKGLAPHRASLLSPCLLHLLRSISLLQILLVPSCN